MNPLTTFILISALFLTAPAQESLADRAAKARNAAPTTPAVTGRIVNRVYQNDVLGLTVKPLDGWEVLGRGQMNVNEAFARGVLNLKGGVAGSAGRVYGMRGAGAGMVISVTKLDPDETVQGDFDLLKKNMRDTIPGVRFFPEVVNFTSPGHAFQTLRVEYDVQNVHMVQSFQGTTVGDQLVCFITTASSAGELTDTLRKIKLNIAWK